MNLPRPQALPHPRLLLLALGVSAAVGCQDTVNVVEETAPTQANQDDTPTPTPWAVGHLTYDPESVDFGPVTLRCTAVQQVRIRNDGQEPVRIFGVGVSLSTSTEFAVDDHLTTLQPFDTLDVAVGYTPGDVGADMGALLVQSDDPSEAVHSLTLTGRDSPGGERVETFYQPPGQPADFLWVLDTSGSMSDDINKVVSNFGQFIDQLEELDVDYQMALITTSLDDEGDFLGLYGQEALPYVTSSMGSAALDEFTQEMLRQSADFKQGDERGLDALALSLSPEKLETIHEGFVRPEARLVVTVFSDEDDHSSITPAAVAQRLLEIKPAGDILFNSIVGIAAPVGDCPSEQGTRYVDLSHHFGGYVDDVCRSSYTKLMETLGDYGSAAESVFTLSGTPEVAYGITVTVDGQALAPAPDPEDLTEGWVYDAGANTVTFGVQSVPPSEARIDITYVDVAACQ